MRFRRDGSTASAFVRAIRSRKSLLSWSCRSVSAWPSGLSGDLPPGEHQGGEQQSAFPTTRTRDARTPFASVHAQLHNHFASERDIWRPPGLQGTPLVRASRGAAACKLNRVVPSHAASIGDRLQVHRQYRSDIFQRENLVDVSLIKLQHPVPHQILIACRPGMESRGQWR